MDPLVPFIKAIIIMDGEGNRLSSKYYAREEFPTETDRVSHPLPANGISPAFHRQSLSAPLRKPWRRSFSRRRSTQTHAPKVGRCTAQGWLRRRCADANTCLSRPFSGDHDARLQRRALSLVGRHPVLRRRLSPGSLRGGCRRVLSKRTSFFLLDRAFPSGCAEAAASSCLQSFAPLRRTS